MFGLRSARGRAILAGAVLVVLLAGIATVAVWRTRDMQQQHDALHHTSAIATALEHAQAQFWEAQATLSALILLGDPSLADEYHDTVASLEQHLSQARADALATGEADHVATLDDLTERIGHFTEQVNLALPIVLEADPETRAQLASASISGMVSEAKAIVADLEELVEAHESDAAAATAAADRATNTTLWLLIGLSAAAFLVAAGTIAMLIVSVVRPLAALRASARAITSGDPEARATVSGPEEVTSLARDFNAMTDALSAKTQEYIDTTNLTGVILLKLDRNGRCAFLNDAACEFLGRPREEILGVEITRYLHPEDIEPTTQALHRMIESKRLVTGVVSRFVTPLGIRVTEWNAYPLFDEQGHYAGMQATGRDITERKQMEEALRLQSEIMQNMAEAVYLIRASDGVIVYTNPAFERLFGYGPGEMIGKHVSVVNAPTDESPEETAKEIMATLGRSGVWRGEILNIKKDGTLFWSYANVSTFDHPGHGRVCVSYHTDITERKRAEEALASSEERLRILFEFAPDAYYLNNLQGNFVDGNRGAEELIGYKRAELIGKSFLELNLLPPGQLQKAAAILAKNVQGLPTGPDELALVRKDGNEVPVEIRTFPVRIGDQTLVLGIARDITERKRAEDALRHSEELTRLIVETAQDAFISIDARGVITAWNAQAERTFGWSRSEAVGRKLSDTIIPPQHREAYERGLERFLATGEGPVLNKSIEITAWHHDGHEFPVELAVWAVRSGDTYTFNAFVRDITERKRAEEERARLHAELEVRAITDGLTGLYNHAHFFQRLAEEIERSKRYGRGFSLLMMDVDNFKQFNDSRGHQAGDEALCLVADCIRTALRRSDIPFRYGGDEFAAMLLHADSSRAQAIAKRMNGCIARRLKKMNNPVAASLGLSTGIACFPQDATTADDLVRIADTALYDAKRVASARRAMQQGQAIDLLASPSGTLDENQQRVLSAAAGSLAAILQDVSVPDILADLDLRTIAAVGAAAEIKDPYIRKHQERVSRLAAALAEEMGLSPKQVQEITIAGLLHDLGKVSISEQILNKPGKLTQEKYAKIKEHAALGAKVIAHIESLQPLVLIVRHHHERFDGKGYPDGLAGEEIPLEARILSVADVFDAMTHQRSYRKALSKAEAMAELERGAGTQFDPAAVKAFLALLEKRGDDLACPVHAASEARPLVTAKAAGRRKG